ncbi:MAG TPA: hypothetical protein VFS33_03640 [Gemmatimonadales bacterium]|nr:hypothetical protein [Gemmatimonadales bacterium]
MTRSATIAAVSLLGGIALGWPAVLAAQEQVCMDGTHASAADGRSCADHGGVDYIATNTGASSLGGASHDTAASTICVDGSKSAARAGLPACPGTAKDDSAASRAMQDVAGSAGQPSKSSKRSQQPQQAQEPGSVLPPRARQVSDTTQFRKDST